jgi:hypothetical protein
VLERILLLLGFQSSDFTNPAEYHKNRANRHRGTSENIVFCANSTTNVVSSPTNVSVKVFMLILGSSSCCKFIY